MEPNLTEIVIRMVLNIFLCFIWKFSISAKPIMLSDSYNIRNYRFDEIVAG